MKQFIVRWMFTLLAVTVIALSTFLEYGVENLFLGTWMTPYYMELVDNLVFCSMLLVIAAILDRKRQRFQNQLQRELARAVAHRDRMLSLISHDLRGPFTTVMNLSETMLDKWDSAPADALKKYAGIIHATSARIYDLLLNLLAWARVQTGTEVCCPQATLVAPAVDNTVHLYRRAAEEKTVTVTTQVPADLAAHTDPDVLKTVLRNLLSNAIKFSRPGGRIEILARAGDGGVLLEVCDQGVGIPAAQQAQLFTREPPMTTLGTREEKGTGLGLVLCRDLLEKQASRMDCESREGSGTTFRIRFPPAS